MNFKRILIEPSNEPNRLRLGIDGVPSATHPFFTLHLYHLGEVREELLWWTALNPDQLGAPHPNEIDGLREGDTYCVYVATEESYQLRNAPNPETLILAQHFSIKNNKVVYLSDDAAVEIRRKMAENASSPMYAGDGHEPEARAFQVVVFYAGVSIHYESSSKGFTVRPVQPGLSNIAAFQAVADYLLMHHSATIPPEPELQPYLRHQPLFSITFHNVISASSDGALKFATQMAGDISTIIASERGDRPFPVLSFILDCTSGNYVISPTNFDLRGNFLPPLFADAHTGRVETLFPIIQSHSFARLILELYTQAQAERDRSFRFFRQWALIEMIADRKIKSTTIPLTNLDGSQINLGSGKPLNTTRKEGKVYAYLRNGELPPIYQGTAGGSARILEGSKGYTSLGTNIEKVVSLWAAVAAAYKIRNDVAHDGKFTPYKEPKDDREILCNEFYEGSYGFLGRALEFAVWREIMEHKQ